LPGTWRDSATFRVTLDDTEYAGACEAVLMIDTQLVQPFLNASRGPMLFQPELGMLVEITADLDHPGQDVASRGENLGWQSSLLGPCCRAVGLRFRRCGAAPGLSHGGQRTTRDRPVLAESELAW
jgi:hypothetical protein